MYKCKITALVHCKLSQVEGRIVNKTTVPHYLCSKNSDWFTLWLSLEQMVPEVHIDSPIILLVFGLDPKGTKPEIMRSDGQTHYMLG